jgi:hypothetical protein
VIRLHVFVLVYLLRAGEITQVQLGSLDHALLVNLLAFDQELKDGMWPWALRIHFGRSRSPISFSSLQQGQAVVFVLHDVLTQPLHVYALHLVLSNRQRLLLLGIMEQVKDLFIVDLNETAEDRDLGLIQAYFVE